MAEVPQSAREITLDLSSRYRNTRLFQDDFEGIGKKVPFFGTWRPPTIRETKPPLKHRLAADEVDRPDLIAHRVYGDASLFWAIALRNNLMLPLVDLRKLLDTPNAVLLCPHIDDVQQALQRASSRNPGTV